MGKDQKRSKMTVRMFLLQTKQKILIKIRWIQRKPGCWCAAGFKGDGAAFTELDVGEIKVGTYDSLREVVDKSVGASGVAGSQPEIVSNIIHSIVKHDKEFAVIRDEVPNIVVVVSLSYIDVT